MNETTSISLTNDTGDMLLVSGSSTTAFCSLNPKSHQDKVNFYNAISSPDNRLGEMINMEIMLRHVYAEECTYTNKQTGEAQAGVRIVLIDKDGVSYNTSSIGVYNSLSRIFQIFGTPQTWKDAMKVRVKQITPSDDKRVLTLELIE